MKFTTLIFSVLLLIFTQISYSQLEQTALQKIQNLENLIVEAESLGIDATKEKMTIRASELFLKYANWDANNVNTNKRLFELVHIFKNNSEQLANELPNFERGEVIIMLDEALDNLKRVMEGVDSRKPVPLIDWSNLSTNNGRIIHQGSPVFLLDHTWKTRENELTEYFGSQDGFYISPSHIQNDQGVIKSYITSNIQGKSQGNFGSIFIDNSNVPNWAKSKYDNFEVGGRLFMRYDIDHPGAKEMMGFLLDGTIPLMANKKYTKLGYLLANEPHWFTAKDVWETGPVSNYTKNKFKNWLRNKHGSIADLNALWGTSFSNFNNVTIQIPINKNLQGTPKWYDWVSFNADRVTNWFTFMKNRIKQNDPTAKTHIKLIPGMWTGNSRDHGLDFEALMNITEVLGNDAKTYNSKMWGPPEPWEERYAFYWRIMAMSYDFFKSVGPNKINYNSEGHFLSTTAFRDLYLKPKYAKAVTWLATLQGMNANQSWLWGRNPDGSIKNNANNEGYAGSTLQQPRILNEVTSTMMDINTFSNEVSRLQRLKKPLRIFHSETSVKNKKNHMDSTFDLYESLYFEGLPLGFATKNIIDNQNNNNWEVILIYKTEFVTKDELNTLQKYLDNGGTIIVDNISVKKDEYGRNHTFGLNPSNGIIFSASSITQFRNRSLTILKNRGELPPLTVKETNNLNAPGCVWRAYTKANGKHLISLVNIGKGKSKIELNLNNGSTNNQISIKNLINGHNLNSTFEMESEDLLLLEVQDKTLSISDMISENENVRLYPNPSDENIIIEFDNIRRHIDIEIFDLTGKKIAIKTFSNNNKIKYNINDFSSGLYLLKVKTNKGLSHLKFIKK